MDELITLIVLCGIAFYAGILYAQMKFMLNISKNPDRIMDMLSQIKKINENEDKGLPEDAIEVETEKVGNVYYGYDKENGMFLCQANSIHEVMVEAAKRNPGKSFWHPELKEKSQTT